MMELGTIAITFISGFTVGAWCAIRLFRSVTPGQN